MSDLRLLVDVEAPTVGGDDGHRRVQIGAAMGEGILRPDHVVSSLEEYGADGGGEGLTRARAASTDAVLDELRASGLRGRGGAGFPTGVKWGSVLGGEGRHRYVVCNGAEGEPGTFKDRALMRANPYQVLEGVLIASHVVGAIEAFVAIKASFERERVALQRALGEMAAAGWVDSPVTIVTGPEEYLFGEEKALLEVIEGNDPLPRWLPPYLHGLFATAPQLGWQAHEPESGHTRGHESNPTLVNNVETLANVTHVLARGASWFRERGTLETAGTLCATVVGDVTRAAVVEVEAGTPLRAVIEACGGPPDGREVRAVFSGVSNPVIIPDLLDTPLSFEAMEAAGTGLGSAGFVVYDESTCLVEVAALLSRFLSVESCGQCPPCKLGSGDITDALERIARDEGSDADLGTIAERLRIVADGNRCALAVEEQRLVGSILRAFPDDFAAHLEQGHCPRPRGPLPIPKVTNVEDGVATYDERQGRKRPDWTYAEG